jgi:hypothetical protein
MYDCLISNTSVFIQHDERSKTPRSRCFKFCQLFLSVNAVATSHCSMHHSDGTRYLPIDSLGLQQGLLSTPFLILSINLDNLTSKFVLRWIMDDYSNFLFWSLCLDLEPIFILVKYLHVYYRVSSCRIKKINLFRPGMAKILNFFCWRVTFGPPGRLARTHEYISYYILRMNSIANFCTSVIFESYPVRTSIHNPGAFIDHRAQQDLWFTHTISMHSLTHKLHPRTTLEPSKSKQAARKS